MKILHAVTLFLLFAVVIPAGPSHVDAATLVTTYHSVSVTTGTGGTVTAGAVNLASVAEGKSVALKLVPAPNYRVQDVTVDGVSRGAVKSVSLKVTKDLQVTATFEKIPYPIGITATPGGTVSGPATGTFDDEKTFTITRSPGYYLVDLKKDGKSIKGSVTDDNTFTITVTGKHKLVATFSNLYAVTASTEIGGTITPKGKTSLKYDATKTYRITPNVKLGYFVKDVIVDGVSQGPLTTINFSPSTAPVEQLQHTVVARFATTAHVPVTAVAGPGGTISPSGIVSVPVGANPVFDITPDDGFSIEDVLVDGVSVGKVTRYAFGQQVTSAHRIEVVFNSTLIRATAGDGGAITPSGEVRVPTHGYKMFTITPAAGHQTVDVRVDGVSVGPVKEYAFSDTTADHTIAAEFAPVHTIAASAGAGGRIDPTGTLTVIEGSSQSYTILPDTGYQIARVEVNGTSIGVASSHTFRNVTTDATIAAFFALRSYAIRASAGSGGSISPTGTAMVPHGETKEYVVTAAPGYHVKDVVVDDVSLGPVSTHTFDTVTRAHTIAATFEPDVPLTYAISAKAGANGTISPAGIATIEAGGAAAFAIVPAPGYHVGSVAVDGIAVGAVDAYTFANVSSNHSIEATFELNAAHLATIIASAGQGGSISPSGAITLPEGAAQDFMITPAAGYHVASLTINGGASAPATSVTLTAGSDTSVTAVFEADGETHTVATTITGLGSVLPSDRVAVPTGGSASLTFIPDEGHRVKGVSVNGVAKGAVTTLTIPAVTKDQAVAVEFEPVPPETFAIYAAAGPGGIVAPPGRSTLDAGSQPAFEFVPAVGYHVQSVQVDAVPIIPVPASPYVFPPLAGDHVLTVRFAPDVPATRTIFATAGVGGSISPNGATVADGGSQTFTITPAAGYRTTRVEVGGVSIGAVAAYTFTDVRADSTIDAYFEPVSPSMHIVTAVAGTGGAISPAGLIAVTEGTSQTFTILPNEGFRVDTILVDGTPDPVAASTRQVILDAVTADHTISATFVPLNSNITHTITAAVAGGQSGWGTISPVGATAVTAGYNQAYAITPAEGYAIANVVVDGVSIGAVTGYPFIGVTADHTITASFIPVYTVRGEATTGGTMSPLGDNVFRAGDSVTFTIVPIDGYVIQKVEITKNGVTVNAGAVSSYTVASVDAYTVVSARFIEAFTIDASASAGGTISPAGKATVLLGGSSSYTITPDPGNTITAVFIDGAPHGKVSNYSFTNVSRNHTIRAEFGKLWKITAAVSVEGGGAITPAGVSPIVEGGSVTYSFTPSAGWYIRDVIVDGVSQGTPTSYTFTGVNADHTISVRFGRQYVVTASAGAGGTISPSGTLILPAGSSQEFTITPNAGYQIQNVQVTRGTTPEQLGAVSTWTLSGLAENVTVEASFIAVFTVDASVTGNGTISPAGRQTYTAGSSPQYTITPAAGHYIVDVVVDGVSKGRITTYTVTNISKAVTIAATFAPFRTITASVTGSGTISPAGAVTVENGASRTYTFAPSGGMVLLDLLVDGISQGTPDDYTFTNVTADHTIVAVFGQPQWKKVTLHLTTTGNIGTANIGVMSVVLTLPAGVYADINTSYLSLPGRAALQTASVFGTTYVAGQGGTGGKVEFTVADAGQGFPIGEFATVTLVIVEGAHPAAGDFGVQVSGVYSANIDPLPTVGAIITNPRFE